MILHDEQEIGTSAGSDADADMKVGEFKRDAVVMINATARSSYKGPTANAGILLSIDISGKTVAQADSFEGESTSMGFFTSASYNVVLRRGESIPIEARVRPRGVGGNSNKGTVIELNVIAISAASGKRIDDSED